MTREVTQEQRDRNAQISRSWETFHNPINEEHWKYANDQHVNFDLQLELQTIVERCVHEYRNNPIVEGVVNTHSIDLLGKSGPTLQVISDSPRYNSMLEEIWQEWWSSCTVDNKSGMALMERYNQNDWLRQISIAQKIDMSNELPSDAIVKTRLLDIAPRRLRNSYVLDSNIINGVRVDKFDRPVQYFISPRDSLPNRVSIVPVPVSADDVVVWYEQKEPGQTVGYPRLAAALPEIAELRDYDSQVMDAARAAADNSWMLETQPGAIEFLSGASPLPAGTQFPTPRRSVKVNPIGYTAKQMQANQPIAHYDKFRHEKMRSIGRGVHMPLLSILLDASNANFSQSRINLNVLYERGLNFLRARWERDWLNVVLKMVEREAQLATFFKSGLQRFVLGRKPRKVSFQWGWEPLGHANPKDYAQAVQQLLAMRLTSPQVELNKVGTTVDKMCEDWKEYESKTEACGLDPVQYSPNGQQVPQEKE